MIYVILSGSFGESLTWVGNPAPPIPTIPAFLTASRISSLEERFQSIRGLYLTSSSRKSFSMMMLLTISPVTTRLGSIAFTVPDTDEKTGAETNPPASAIIWPLKTLSPLFTIGLAGAPMCCDTG